MRRRPKKPFNFFGVILIFIGFVYMYNLCSSGNSHKKRFVVNKANNKMQESEWRNLQLKKIKIIANEDSVPDTTRNFYFIIDGSGSMAEDTDKKCGNNENFRNRLEGAKWAVKEFLKNIPDNINIGLYVFDNRGQREVVPLSKNNRDKFLNGISSIIAGGGTPLKKAIKYGTDKLVEQYKTQLGYGEYRLVVVTDGIARHIFDAAKYAASYGVSLYSIGLCVDKNHPLRKYSVLYKAADSFEDLSESLSETLAELHDFDVSDFNEEQEDGK